MRQKGSRARLERAGRRQCLAGFAKAKGQIGTDWHGFGTAVGSTHLAPQGGGGIDVRSTAADP